MWFIPTIIAFFRASSLYVWIKVKFNVLDFYFSFRPDEQRYYVARVERKTVNKSRIYIHIWSVLLHGK